MQGCTAISHDTIPTRQLLATFANTNVNCFGGSDGSAAATPAGGIGAYSFIWSPAGGTQAVANNLSAGAYTLTVSDSTGCSSIFMDTIIQPSAIAVVISTMPATTGVSNGSATVTPSGGTPPYSYAWTVAGSGDSIGGLPAGTYTVTITDAHSCDTVVSITLSEVTGLIALNSNSALSIYLNPSNGVIYIHNLTTGDVESQIIVYDISGRIISKLEMQILAGGSQKELNVRNLGAGIYLMELKTGNTSYFEKVIITSAN